MMSHLQVAKSSVKNPTSMHPYSPNNQDWVIPVENTVGAQMRPCKRFMTVNWRVRTNGRCWRKDLVVKITIPMNKFKEKEAKYISKTATACNWTDSLETLANSSEANSSTGILQKFLEVLSMLIRTSQFQRARVLTLMHACAIIIESIVWG